MILVAVRLVQQIDQNRNVYELRSVNTDCLKTEIETQACCLILMPFTNNKLIRLGVCLVCFVVCFFPCCDCSMGSIMYFPAVQWHL